MVQRVRIGFVENRDSQGSPVPVPLKPMTDKPPTLDYSKPPAPRVNVGCLIGGMGGIALLLLAYFILWYVIKDGNLE